MEGGPTTRQLHNGGALAFGNDGKLYVTTGDGGDNDSVQPLNNTHGSILRLNDDGSVPVNNPFADSISYRCADYGGAVPKNAPEGAVCSEVFANGVRNAFRMTMDPNEKEKVRFAVSDVGGAHWEEISWGGTDFAGRNYGYPRHEGPCLRGHSNRCQLPGDKNILEPFHWYAHRKLEEGGCVAGSAFVPEHIGWPSKYKILFADFVFSEVYSLIEDPDAYCRSCRPPTSGYTNETFYTFAPREDAGRITDIFFGPYKNTQALYVISRGSPESVIRIRYTGNEDNSPPEPVIKVIDLDYQYVAGEVFHFDSSKSTDPDGDSLTITWDFGDGTTSNQEKPTHAFENPGTYDVKLMVTDSTGISQQTSMTIRIGKPPSVSILSPTDDEVFFVGQVFQLKGEAFNHKGEQLKDTQLTWEVRKHHADHFHPFLDPTVGNDLELFPAPEPEDFFASTNSYLRIILRATDEDGLTSQIERIIQPWKIDIGIESSPPGIEVTVDAHPLKTSGKIVSWKGHKLNVLAKNQPPYMFKEWWDGNTQQERKIQLNKDGQVLNAIYCSQDYWICMADDDCCSGSCNMMACTSETNEPEVQALPEIGEKDIGTNVTIVDNGNASSVADPVVDNSTMGGDKLDAGDETIWESTRTSTALVGSQIDELSSTGVVLISIGCGLVLIAVGVLGYVTLKRKSNTVTGPGMNDNLEVHSSVGKSEPIVMDEENGVVEVDRSNENQDASDVDCESSNTGSAKDSLNDTLETGSSAS